MLAIIENFMFRTGRVTVRRTYFHNCRPVPSPGCVRVVPCTRIRLRSSRSEPPRPLPTTRLPVLQRAATFLRENPYTRFSLILCGVVLSLSIAVELYKKYRKTKPPDVVLMPPRVGHFTIKRASDVEAIAGRIQSLRRRGSGPTAVYLVGPSGAGKSELAYQYTEHFINRCQSGRLKSQQSVVLYLNGATPALFETTLRESAMSMGVKDSEMASGTIPSGQNPTPVVKALKSKLTESNQPWLIVVDGLTPDTLPGFVATFYGTSRAKDSPPGKGEEDSPPGKEEEDSPPGEGEEDSPPGEGEEDWEWSKGGVLVTSQSFPPVQSLPEDAVMEVPAGMGREPALQLLRGIVGEPLEEEAAVNLVELLLCSPLAVSLAASTIKTYSSLLENVSGLSDRRPLTQYAEILSDSLRPSAPLDEVVEAALSLYVEAATTDPRIRHSLDLLGTCDLRNPVPSVVVAHHLANSFYGLPPLTPPLPPTIPPPTEDKETSTPGAYLKQIKAMIPFMGSTGPSNTYQAELSKYIQALEDQVPFVRDSPILTFKKYRKTGVELVYVHHSAHSILPHLFLRHTVPGLDHAHLKQAEDNFNRTAWFRRYRSFDPLHALQAYHRSLPGLSAIGVLTENQFESSQLEASAGRDMASTYDEYAHRVSHYHRVISSLTGVLKSLGRDVEDMQLKNYLQPHLRACSAPTFLSKVDALSCSYSLVSIQVFLSSAEQYPEIEWKLSQVLAEQEGVLGSGHPAVARTLTDLADLRFSLGDSSGARQLLESAVAIYEKLPRETIDESAMDIGLTLASLGLVLNSVGEKVRSCQFLEQALGHYQFVQPGKSVTNAQRKLVAGTLIDVAHAYMSLGDTGNAKKYIDLANMAVRNIYPEAHPETIRALNVMSIVYSMLGDRPESQRVRQEAGKLQHKLDTQPMLL